MRKYSFFGVNSLNHTKTTKATKITKTIAEGLTLKYTNYTEVFGGIACGSFSFSVGTASFSNRSLLCERPNEK